MPHTKCNLCMHAVGEGAEQCVGTPVNNYCHALGVIASKQLLKLLAAPTESGWGNAE